MRSPAMQTRRRAPLSRCHAATAGNTLQEIDSVMPRLTVEGIGTFDVPAGKRLVNALADECGLDQLHACGGLAQCATCRVIFLSGEPEAMRPAECDALAAAGLAGQPGVRLSCQIACDADMSVRAYNRLAGSGRADAGPRPADAFEPEGLMKPVREPVREVETFRVMKWLNGASDRQGEEPLFRPTLRPAVPVLTVLDDGSMDVGEEIRIRQQSFVIGRSAGDLTLPNDATISKEHAEIRLVSNRGIAHWMLHDRGSQNGTFVRVDRANFFVDTVVVIGSRRYRLDGAFQPSAAALSDRGTLHVDREASGIPWPALVDSSGRPDALRYPIRKPLVTIGGALSGCDIELDDPLVARHHATLHRDPSGVWQILTGNANGDARNGVWANIQAVALTPYCFFQCGEQRFRFMIP